MGPKKRDASAEAEPGNKKAKVVMSEYMPTTWPKEEYAHAQAGAVKLVSYNVNGINAASTKGLYDYVAVESPDVLVIQETKLQESKVMDFDAKFEQLGYPHRYWSCSTAKKGYSGTASFSKTKPLEVLYGLGEHGEHNEEGRTITLEFSNYFLVNSYVPNSGQKLERLDWRQEVWDRSMLKHLEWLKGKGKGIVFTGDFNVAHNEIDLKNPKSNKNKTAGFCDQEREGFSNFLSAGFDDTYRRLNPETEGAYTYYGMRFNGYGSGSGWRIDYWLATKCLRKRIQDTHIRSKVYGASDHCPIVLYMKSEDI